MELHGHFNAIAGEPLRRGRRVVYDSVGRLVHAGSDHAGFGSVAEKDVNADEAVAVRPLFDPGVHLFINAGGIAKPGNPIFAASGGKVSIVGSVVVGYVADMKLDVEFDGDFVSVIPCPSGGSSPSGVAPIGSIVLSPIPLTGYAPVNEFVELSKTTDAVLYQFLLTHSPDVVREIPERPHLFGFNL